MKIIQAAAEQQELLVLMFQGTEYSMGKLQKE
jgi:hypothetical protein